MGMRRRLHTRRPGLLSPNDHDACSSNDHDACSSCTTHDLCGGACILGGPGNDHDACSSCTTHDLCGGACILGGPGLLSPNDHDACTRGSADHHDACTRASADHHDACSSSDHDAGASDALCSCAGGPGRATSCCETT